MPRQSPWSNAGLLPILLPSIGNIVFVSIFFILTFGSAGGLLGDGDTGYHIKTGQVILRNWSIPTKDFYSFHRPPLPWTAHEWLSEVIMGILFNWWGLTGVVVFFAALLALAHWLLYRQLKSKSDDLILCTFITLLASVTSSVHWLARPHVFSLLLIIVWTYFLDRFQSYNENKFLYYFPFVMLFWVNLHAGFIMGLVLLGIYVLHNCITALAANADLSRSSRSKAKALSLALIVCLAACLINPYGFNILLFPIRVTSDRFVMDHVTEFLTPNFHQVLPFKYMLLIMIAALALSRTALGFAEIALLVLLSYMALYSERHVSLFAVIVAPVLLKTVTGLIETMPDSVSTWHRTHNLTLMTVDGKLRGYVWPTMSIVFVVGLAMTGVLSYRFDERKFPVNAIEFLKRQTIAGNIFNDDEFGDYMIFAAWPTYRVFMDGRSDMYGEKFGRDYLRIVNLQPGWKEILKKYDIRVVIFDTESALTAALYEQKDWQSVYSDQVATIFVKKDTSLLPEYPTIS